MKLKEWIKHLNELTTAFPDILEHDVVYAKDSEGNGFYPVKYHPQIGNFDGEDFVQEGKSNSVCLN